MRCTKLLSLLMMICSLEYLALVVGQEVSLWDENLVATCGNSTNTDCFDARMEEIFANLTQLYNPEGGFSNISYLDHHIYESTCPLDLTVTLNSILKLSATNYSQSEIDTIKAFPYN